MDLPAGAPLREKLRAEKEKLREMTFKKKLEYIWDYYKYPIIGFCVGLILLGSFINTRYINPPPGSALFIAWSAGFATDEQIDKLKTVLDEQIVAENINKEVFISMFFDSEFNPAGVQRLMAMLAAGEIDLFIVDPPLLEEYAAQTFIRPLDNMLAEIKTRNPTIYTLMEENIVYALFKSDDGSITEQAMGINIGGSPLLTKLEFYEQELIISISINIGNLENAVRGLIAFYEQT